MARQKSDKARQEAAMVRNKLEIQEKETKIRGTLLEAFNKEDEERLAENAERRLSGLQKSSKSN